MGYWTRALEGAVHEISGQFPALLLTGPRQSGKTTLLRHLAGSGRRYLTLDDPALRELARQDPRLLLQRFAPPVLIDEVQHAPELLPLIKIAIDEDRTPGRFWLTGSQQFHAMRGITETLAGRVAIVSLLGFSERERRSFRVDVEPFLPTTEVIEARGCRSPPVDLGGAFESIFRGSMPQLWTHPEHDRELFLRSYLQTYLQRDVRDLAQVGDLDAFTRFVRACAARTAQLLNLSDLARDVDVSVPTAKAWLSVLTASYQVHVIPPFHSNVTKRLVKTPKMYFVDTGLCAYLTGWSSAETLAAGAMAGPIFETHVVMEVLKSWWHRGREPFAYHYRDRDGNEVDLVLERDGCLFPIEVKRSATVRADWARTFSPLGRLGMPIAPGAVVCLAPQPVPLAEGHTAVNVGCV